MQTLKALVEPYPQLVAGTPQSWSFNATTSTFKLVYTTARATVTVASRPAG